MTTEPPESPPPSPDPGAVTAPYAPSASTPGLPPGVGWSAPVPARQEIAPGLVFSDTLSRIAAWWIDGIFLAIVVGLIAAALGWGANAPPFDTPTGEVAYAELFAATETTVLGLVMSAVYFIGSWSGGRRATLGQRLLKIQVGNAFDGRPLTLDQAVRRWLGFAEFVWLLGFIPNVAGFTSLYFVWSLVLLITTATSPTKQGIHDRMANSAVVRPADAGNGVALACAAILIILALVAVLSIIALVFLGAQVSSILSGVGESI